PTGGQSQVGDLLGISDVGLTTTRQEGAAALGTPSETTGTAPGLSPSDLAGLGLTGAQIALLGAELAGADIPPEVRTGLLAGQAGLGLATLNPALLGFAITGLLQAFGPPPSTH